MMIRRAKTKRLLIARYCPEILQLQASGFGLRQISKELYSRHRVKVSFNYISEILTHLKTNSTPPDPAGLGKTD